MPFLRERRRGRKARVVLRRPVGGETERRQLPARLESIVEELPKTLVSN